MNFDEYRARQQETTLDGLKISFVDEGQGPTLLLIHGIPVWGYLWKDCLKPLVANFRVIIPDLVGYGYSDHRDSFDRSIKVQARILAGLLNHLQIDMLFVVGHDIGGAVAQRFVVDNATCVPKWVLIDSVLYDSWPTEPMIRLGNPQLHYRTKGAELAQKFIERLPDSFYHRDIASPELMAGWMAPYMTETGKLSLIRNATALNTNHTMEILPDLHQLTIPLLLLWGEKDQFQPLTTAERFHQEFPQTKLKVIPDSDHFLPLEKGLEVAQILLNYLRGG